MTKSIRLGILGCGQIVQDVHFPNLATLPSVVVTAFAETDAEQQAQARTAFPQATLYEDYRELLNMAEVDAVLIALPNALHAEATIHALQMDKHVYLEKPFAMTLEEGQNILTAAQQSDKVGMMGFAYRYNPLYHKTKQHISAGRLGEVRHVQSTFAFSEREHAAWHQDPAQGGALHDIGVHHIDLLHYWMASDVVAVNALASELHTAVMQLQFANGAFAQVTACWQSAEIDRFDIYGSQAFMHLDRYANMDAIPLASTRKGSRLKLMMQQINPLGAERYWFQKIRAPYHEPAFHACLSAFISSIKTGDAPNPSLLDGYRSLVVAQACQKAAETGQTVTVDYTI